jgi:hypothetical protein
MTFSWLICGVEKCPNYTFFAIISQTLPARIMTPFASSPHVAASYDFCHLTQLQSKFKFPAFFI